MKHFEYSARARRRLTPLARICAALAFGIFCALAAAAQQNYTTVDFQNTGDISGTFVTHSSRFGWSTGGLSFHSQIITSTGVTLSGGFPFYDLDTMQGDYESWLGSGCFCSNSIQISFPPYATDISMDIDGYAMQEQFFGPAIWAPLVVDNNGTVVATVGTPFLAPITWQNVYIGQPQGQITIHAPNQNGGFFRIHVDNIRFRIQPPAPPVFQFEYDSTHPGERLLLHKYLASDKSGPFGNGYFSPYQVDNVPSGQPPQFRIPGVVSLNGSPSVRTVYFRVLDPPDPAPYAQPASVNDNRDLVTPKGRLFYLDSSGQRVEAGTNGQLAVTSNQDGVAGRVVVYLETTDHVAGDNYQVEASFDSGFQCASAGSAGADICPRSATVTTWKRVYFETDTMFRRGAFLARAAAGGDRELYLHADIPGEPPPFLVGDVITLIHGIQRDWHSEDVEIDPNPVDASGNQLAPMEELSDGSWILRLRSPLMGSYAGPTTNAGNTFWYRADAAGVQGSYFTPNTGALSSFYEDMYVDVQDLTDQISQDFPYIEEFGDNSDDVRRLLLARQYFYHLPSPGGQNGNIFHLIGAGKRVMQVRPTVPPSTRTTCTTNFGDTLAGGANFSYVYVGNMELQVTGVIPPCTFRLPILATSIDSFVRASTTHETVHEWRVNRVSQGTGGHCSAPASRPRGAQSDICLMNAAWPIGITNWGQLNQPRLGLHWLNGGADSEYTDVRTAEEPVTK